MIKVYIVTAGDYSDYGIRAVFSTRELAEAFIAKYGNSLGDWGDTPVIEEWTLDDPRAIGDHMMQYRVSLARNGDVHYVEPIKLLSVGGPYSETKPVFLGLLKDGGVAGSVLARDEQHAVKIANEKRAQLIAEREAGMPTVRT